MHSQTGQHLNLMSTWETPRDRPRAWGSVTQEPAQLLRRLLKKRLKKIMNLKMKNKPMRNEFI